MWMLIYNRENAQPNQLIATLSTDNSGYVEAELSEGSYSIQIEKYSLTKSCNLEKDIALIFRKPSFILTVEVYDEKKKPMRNIEISIFSVEKYSRFKNVSLKTDKEGYIGTKIPFGVYMVEIKKI